MNLESFWRNKVVLITGASSGIGAALAELVAARGAKVGLLARNEERLVELKSRIAGVCEYALVDVTDADATRAGAAQLESRLGACDILVANAGINRPTDGRAFDPQRTRDANEIIAVNVCGVINSFAAVLPGMVQRRGGHLCAVSSVGGILGLPLVSVYSASKAAVLTLCDGLRVDLKPVGVRVTVVGPGFTDTPLLRQIAQPPGRIRLMTPAEAAGRIAWAIERGRARHFFPTRLWLQAWIGSKLPPSWYAAVWRWMARKKRELKQRGEW